MNRRGKMRISSIVLVFVLAYGGLFLRNLWPVFWTKVMVDEVVKLSLLEWRDKSEGKALARMKYELAKRDVPENIVFVVESCGPRGCCLFEREKDVRHADCWWDEEVEIPFTNQWVKFEFSVHKFLDPDDHLHDWKGD
jgi:hypothetical protein